VARQAGLRLARFRLMQAPIFATSGMNSLQSRSASGVQACRCSAEPCAAAGAGVKSTAPANPKTAALASHNDETFLSPAFFIGESVPLVLEIVPAEALPVEA
jgi:hypothetical protein